MDKEFNRLLYEAALSLGEKDRPEGELRLAEFRRKRRKKAILRVSTAVAAGIALIIAIPFAVNMVSENHPPIVTPPVYIVDNNGMRIDVVDFDETFGFAAKTGDNSIRYDSSGTAGLDVMHTLIVPKGAQFALTLSDGTRLRVNSGSSVCYPANFSSDVERRLKLNYGEIFLEVTHDQSRPFVVATSMSDTKVLGTRFNVQAYSDRVCNVTLLEGSVAVKQPHQAWDESRTIRPGENAAVSPEAINITYVDTKNYAAWIDGYYYYDKKTVGQILGDICVRYDYALEGSADDQDLVRFWFESNEDMGKVISRLGKVANVKISIDGKTIRLAE